MPDRGTGKTTGARRYHKTNNQTNAFNYLIHGLIHSHLNQYFVKGNTRALRNQTITEIL